jgi:two-component system nitrogen regulation response regulator GlnG
VHVARLLRKPIDTRATRPAPDEEGLLVGSCPAMQEVYKAIGRVAGHAFPVLITGESGTGKELVARALYEHGPRAGAPFLALNCAAIPEQLLESELFGHEKGAFTGADRRRMGKFEQCSGGTLFLDEIGDMPLALQAKLLRVLQDQSFERVGGNETIRTDVRLVAATHRDLKKWVAEGRFRADLYYRLGVFTIHLPPLRERGEDLPLLVEHYLRHFSRELGREVRQAAPEALERLGNYAWPGNVRELQSVLRQALLRASGSVLLQAFLPPLAGEALAAVAIPAGAPLAPDANLKAFVSSCLNSAPGDLYDEAHRHMDRLLLAQVLTHAGGNQCQAASRLGVSRMTLRRRLRELGLKASRWPAGEERGADRPLPGARVGAT